MKPAPVKTTVSMDILEKVDIRVGTIISVEDMPRSKKLMKLVVDFGDQSRTILAGIKQERPLKACSSTSAIPMVLFQC
jgi:tRNA-binding protein